MKRLRVTRLFYLLFLVCTNPYFVRHRTGKTWTRDSTTSIENVDFLNYSN